MVCNIPGSLLALVLKVEAFISSCGIERKVFRIVKLRGICRLKIPALRHRPLGGYPRISP